MKTCCPGCQTTFRVTSEQLKARAGKVRCGECRKVFNALDSLLDDAELLEVPTAPPTAGSPPSSTTHAAPAVAVLPSEEERAATEADADAERGEASEQGASAADEVSSSSTPGQTTRAFEPLQVHHTTHHSIPETVPTGLPGEAPTATVDRAERLAEIGDDEHGRLPRESKEVPGYNRWLEGTITEPVPPVAAKTLRAPFVIAIIVLVLALAGQIIFHFRGVIALTTPSTRPALAALSAALGTDIPLPRHVDLVSIDASDLLTEPGRSELLSLQATLRNRASYAQAFPAIELTLTDTADKAVVRRVFMPDEYLAQATLDEGSFRANADIEVRLWLDGSKVNAAGYRLYVFYP